MKTPELLSPGGSLDKLKIAALYGADAVYVGLEDFNLRAASKNFTLEELKEGVRFLHERGKRLYLTLNSFLHGDDLNRLESLLDQIKEFDIDAAIISDIGVMKYVQEKTNIPIHVSTQASCLNIYDAKIWKSFGAKRVVLGREVSIEQAGRIKREAGLEVELFIHGSMCMAYSGHCTISNYTQGRDSNRGGCAHSCRFEYSLETSSQRKNAFFMSSKDLFGLELIEKYKNADIDSIKVEGRMKSINYLASVTKMYACALKSLKNDEKIEFHVLKNELSHFSHRDSTYASLLTKADETSIYNSREQDSEGSKIIGNILDVSDNYAVVEVRAQVNKKDNLEVISFDGKNIFLGTHMIQSLGKNQCEKFNPGQLMLVPRVEGMEQWQIVRKLYE